MQDFEQLGKKKFLIYVIYMFHLIFKLNINELYIGARKLHNGARKF